MLTRRGLLQHAGTLYVASSLHLDKLVARGPKGMRCINIVNFMRGNEPRFKTDLLLPVQKQMELILQHRLPATWLLQYDALVSGPFVGFLKAHMARDHEVGTWFEMNQMHCEAAGVEWRGRPGYEWDYLPPVAFSIGYTPEERVKLADTAMAKFKEVWGKHPSSVASWNLDALTVAHMAERYGVDAFAVCRDQIATDGFTIWGAPIMGYYPSKSNCWSPALRKSDQIGSPVFRMLGQDPVYYYDKGRRLPNGHVLDAPDTMEPVTPSGHSKRFIDTFLDMTANAPCLGFEYAQLGQENNFPWEEMREGYPIQMEALARLRDKGGIRVETMGETGRRFKKAFPQTPAQAQVMLDDPIGISDPAEGSVWYQSRFYRANLHLQGDLPFLRDITVYSDRFSQPFLREATRLHEVEQRMPAILDGYHWSKNPGSWEGEGARGLFLADGQVLRLVGKPRVSERGSELLIELPVHRGSLKVTFSEDGLVCGFSAVGELTLSFEWDPARAALVEVQPAYVAYRWNGFDYGIRVLEGRASKTESGYRVSGERIKLRPAQID